jgi:hypothetical protein
MGGGRFLMSEVPLHKPMTMRFVPLANEVANTEEQESSLLTTYWSESTIHVYHLDRNCAMRV